MQLESVGRGDRGSVERTIRLDQMQHSARSVYHELRGFMDGVRTMTCTTYRRPAAGKVVLDGGLRDQ